MIKVQRYLGIQGKSGSTQEKEGSTEEIHSKKDVKNLCPDDEDKMEDSPVLGLLHEEKSVKLETEEAEGNGKNAIPSETMIKKAIRKRSSYVKANSEKVTMAGLRRLLEEDLKLENLLSIPKKLISQQLGK
ncbi:uncharacterized protein LOC129294561 [Prosopis cineraria]|uniref:uncharacterized protein LOC129294561 n=1 Tax=Prosopis cineraria TaxID=364024 RepID=UPI00240ECBDA|nr:uncharacterized protein LOC129294561 [Prosopis cineraria]